MGDLGIVIPLAPGKGAEVIVEAVVLLDDDHNVINFAGPEPTRRLLHRNHVRAERLRKNLFYACSIAINKHRRIKQGM